MLAYSLITCIIFSWFYAVGDLTLGLQLNCAEKRVVGVKCTRMRKQVFEMGKTESNNHSRAGLEVENEVPLWYFAPFPSFTSSFPYFSSLLHLSYLPFPLPYVCLPYPRFPPPVPARAFVGSAVSSCPPMCLGGARLTDAFWCILSR